MAYINRRTFELNIPCGRKCELNTEKQILLWVKLHKKKCTECAKATTVRGNISAEFNPDNTTDAQVNRELSIQMDNTMELIELL